jgi:hypothetical protein
MIELFDGPDRDRTDDLFHAISATSRNSLILHDINRDETQQDAHIPPRYWTLNGPPTLEIEIAMVGGQKPETALVSDCTPLTDTDGRKCTRPTT